MNELQIFENSELGQVRTLVLDGKPWFVAADVCIILGHTNPTVALDRLDNDERAKFNLGRQGETNIVNEPGLYTLVLGSRKPEAKTFKRWITHEVIPSIRKNGAYMTPEAIEAILVNPDTIIELATRLKKAREEFETLQKQKSALERTVEEQRPKVLFAQAVETAHNSILVGELAKIIKQNDYPIGQNRLFEWMRENGFLIKRKGTDYNMPTQYAMEMGLFQIRERTVTNPDGSTRITKTPKVTGKGQQYFISKFLDNFSQKKQVALLDRR